MAKEEGYDPRKSKVSDDTMEKWRTSAITGSIDEVPGIGPKTAEKLAEGDSNDDRITNTYQLFGKFLMLKGPDSEGRKVESFEHTEKFWYFLKNKGISQHRSAIVKAIAEKSATYFRDLYDPNQYESDEEEE